MRTPPNMPDMPQIPQDDEGPVFREPWEAQAFAMTLKLYDEGHFSWPEWVRTLTAEIDAAQAAGDPDLGDTYYLHWLAALEKIVAKKGLGSSEELATRKAEWREADEHRGFGEAPVLARDRGHDHDRG